MDSRGGDQGNIVNTESEKRNAKLRRSCELCRASKARCCPSRDDIRCQKCVKEEKECIFLEAKPRPKRAKNSRMRVAEMEQKLDSLYALLASGAEVPKETISLPALTQAEPQPTFPFETLQPYNSPPPLRCVAPHFPVFSLPYLVFDDIQDVISKGIVTFDLAERSLQLFRTKACNFPFVVVSEQTSLDSLRRERPFLLHSILTFGAQSDLKLQRALELELRESLSKKVIVNGEKSMDLLQGVLIYLAWYHFYYNADRQAVYQLTQVAATMAVDLGINKPAQSVITPWNFTVFNSTPRAFNSRKNPEEIEARRTYLGCYYLSSAICLGLRKPNVLKYREYVEESAETLAQVHGAESDRLLPSFIRIRRLAEEISQAFDYHVAFHQPPLDSVRVEILTRNFAQKLTQLELEFSTEIQTNVTIKMSYHSLKIYMNEVGFHANVPSPRELMSGNSSQTWYYSASRNEILIACLQSTKSYLDYFLALPSSELFNFTLPDFLHLLYAILILSRFTSGCDAPTLDAGYMRKTANLGHYLDSLISKTDELITLTLTHNGMKERQDCIYLVRCLFQGSKLWYNRVIGETASAAFGEAEIPELSFMDILPSILGRCVDLSGTERGRCVMKDDKEWLDLWCPEEDEFSMVLVEGNKGLGDVIMTNDRTR